MRGLPKYAVLVATVAVLLPLSLLYSSSGIAPANALKMSFLGYTTNTKSNDDQRFALICISNQAPYSIRWHGEWVEVEGSPSHTGRIVDPSLPGYPPYALVLKPGASMKIAAGAPCDGSGGHRWRWAMKYSRYTWRERWFDFALPRRLPMKVGPVSLVGHLRLYVATTMWLSAPGN